MDLFNKCIKNLAPTIFVLIFNISIIVGVAIVALIGSEISLIGKIVTGAIIAINLISSISAVKKILEVVNFYSSIHKNRKIMDDKLGKYIEVERGNKR